MSLLAFSRRVGAWLLCLALLVGPVGPGGAWHVAHVDGLETTAATTSATVAVGDPSGRGEAPEHTGPSCLVCQTIHGVRAVMPTAVALAIAPPSIAACLPETSRPQTRDASDASPSRAPPLA